MTDRRDQDLLVRTLDRLRYVQWLSTRRPLLPDERRLWRMSLRTLDRLFSAAPAPVRIAAHDASPRNRRRASRAA